ncbi:hypothetical protein [Lentibacter sp. XHP0401]|jgi:hypothetical protein|nr:hypothetical protein [Lentibacter sp. XHP0401]MCV2894225.1 hypothetical protein [Lentibacter sp. XHP0401]
MQATPKRKRWLENVIKAAQSETTTMPWERGSRRAVFISTRKPISDAA